jgi:hypothetical protein
MLVRTNPSLVLSVQIFLLYIIQSHFQKYLFRIVAFTVLLTTAQLPVMQ